MPLSRASSQQWEHGLLPSMSFPCMISSLVSGTQFPLLSSMRLGICELSPFVDCDSVPVAARAVSFRSPVVVNASASSVGLMAPRDFRDVDFDHDAVRVGFWLGRGPHCSVSCAGGSLLPPVAATECR